MPEILTLPAFNDNYIWMMVADGRAAVVDPGDAAPVLAALEREQLTLTDILLTHHHGDHIGGVAELVQRSRGPLAIHGAAADQARIAGITHAVDDGERFRLSGIDLEFTTLAVPGHTRAHLAYHCPSQAWLFCGDTLFASGCGRLFEGTPQQMYAALAKLMALPEDTRVYCAHEYTLSNLAFARAVEPNRAALLAESARVTALREAGTPSVPTTVAHEREFNPFVRTHLPQVRAAAEQVIGHPLADRVEIFAALRAWKDQFRA